jgi:GTP-binding protein HflX
LPSHRRVLLSDTVGFVRDLPPDLVAAFRATLEEVEEAALILHVTDISNPHHAEHDAEVLKVLAELGVKDRPRLHVLNKIDRLSEQEADSLLANNGQRNKCFVSSLTGEGLHDLVQRIDEAMPVDPLVRLRLYIPTSDGRTLSLVHACGRVLHHEISRDRFVLDAELPESLARRLDEFTRETVPEDGACSARV